MIRNMQLSDIPGIIAIEQLDSYSPWTALLIKDCINHEHYYNWVLESERDLVGYVMCNIAVSECHLMNIAIRPECRQQGYGQTLLKHAIATCKNLAEYMILEVRQDNQPAKQLYEKFGFTPIGVRHNYYNQGGDNRDAVVYRLEL